MGAAGQPRHPNTLKGSYIRPQSAPMGAPVHQESTWQPRNIPKATPMSTHGCCRTAQAPKHPQGFLYPTPICTHGCSRAPREHLATPKHPKSHSYEHPWVLQDSPGTQTPSRVPISDPNLHPWVLQSTQRTPITSFRSHRTHYEHPWALP